MPPKQQHQKPPPGICFAEDYTDNDGNILVPGIATRLGIAYNTYRKWRMAKKGPDTFKLGKRVAAREDAVASWLTEQAGAPLASMYEMRPPEPRASKRKPRKATALESDTADSERPAA